MYDISAISLATELNNITMEAQDQGVNLGRMKNKQENKPETCRNSPDMLPYLWTACSNAFFTVDPFIWTKSTVPPNGRTVRMSSMVMEPIEKHTYHTMIMRSKDFSCETLSNPGGRVTIFVVLIYGRPYGSTVQHTEAHMIPL